MDETDRKKEFPDFIKFKDDDGKIKEWFVKLMPKDSTHVIFKTIGGNIYHIPKSDVYKIKERGSADEDVLS